MVNRGTAAVSATWKVLAAVAASVCATALLGCETQPLYGVCALDKVVTDKFICTAQKPPAGEKDTSSCVVRQHPHCDHNVCLSYFGLDSFCTTACTGDDDPVCGSQAFCWTFSEADPATKSTTQRYCVPNSKKVAAGQK